VTTHGRVSAGRIIVALGVGSTALVRSLGMRVPAYPEIDLQDYALARFAYPTQTLFIARESAVEPA
jgi:glycine/D-amino acid oxidase-like deaminating enzyme